MLRRGGVRSSLFVNICWMKHASTQIIYFVFFAPFCFLTANEDLKAVFAESKEGNIRIIKIDIIDGKTHPDCL